MSEFLTLPSNASMDVFPGNTAASFRTKLSRELDFSEGEYEVGLSEISFPHDFQPKISGGGEGLVFLDSEGDGNEIEVFNFPPGEFRSVYHLMRGLVTTYPNRLEFIHYIGGIFRIKLYPPGIFYRFLVEPKEAGTRPVRRLLNELAGEEAVRHNIIPTFCAFRNEQIPVKKSRFYEVKNLIITNEERLYLDLKIKETKKFIPFIEVYSDLIEGREVDGELKPILRSIPLSGKEGAQQTTKFDRPFFFPLIKNKIRTIKIQLRDLSEELIKFESAPVTVTLQFRRRTKPL